MLGSIVCRILSTTDPRKLLTGHLGEDPECHTNMAVIGRVDYHRLAEGNSGQCGAWNAESRMVEIPFSVSRVKLGSIIAIHNANQVDGWMMNMGTA